MHVMICINVQFKVCSILFLVADFPMKFWTFTVTILNMPPNSPNLISNDQSSPSMIRVG